MNDRSVYEFYCHHNERIPLAEIKGEISRSPDISQIKTQTVFGSADNVEITHSSINQNITTYNSRREDNLFELEKLEDFQPPLFPTPQVDNLLSKNKRLLLLGGKHDDKKELARYFAANLLERDSQSRAKVFILYDITPQYLHKNLSLSQIDSYAKDGNNYVIAITDTPLDSWVLSKDDKLNYWYVPPVNNLYEPIDLVKSFFENFQKLDKEMKTDADFDFTELKPKIEDRIKKYELQTFASILRCARGINNLETIKEIKIIKADKKPEKTETLERLYKELDEPLNEIFSKANDQKNSLEKWYEYLEEKDKLIALALTFFDGCLEDQFFEALYKLVIESRSFRIKDLESADKADLKNLENHFTLNQKKYPQKLSSFTYVKTKSETTEIEIRSIHIRSDERLSFFEIAWEKYRMQILNSLPVIINLIKESAEEVPTNLALYGSPLHRTKLREVLVQTLSDLGLVPGAISAVQEALFQLATDQRFELKEVAAKVIEKWYSFSRSEADKKQAKIQGEKESLGTLQLFYGRAMDVGRSTEKSREYQDNVIATIALAVTRIATYDDPGKLSDDICDWLKELANNQSPIVANYLGYNTLYNLVLQHMGDKLSETLKDITQLNDLLNDPIAASLARAYEQEEYADKVQNALNAWYQECDQNWSNTDNRHQRLLRTVATAYGLIQFPTENNTIPIIDVFRRLHTILIKEEQFFVCKPTTIAIITLSKQYFEQIELGLVKSELDGLGNRFSDDKRSQIVEVLTKVYQGKTQLAEQVNNIPQHLEFLFRTVGLSLNINQSNNPVVNDTLEKLFSILGQEPNSLMNEAVIIALRLLAQNYFAQFISELKTLTSQISEEQRQEIINILIEIYLDQRSTQTGGDGELEVKGYKYPTYTNSKRKPTDVEKEMSNWLNIDKNSESQQQIAIETSLEFIRALGTLDPASFSTGIIKDLENYAPKCSSKQRNKFVNILTEIYRDQHKLLQQGGNDEETDIEKIIIYWLKNDNNSAIKEIAMRASVEFEDA